MSRICKGPATGLCCLAIAMLKLGLGMDDTSLLHEAACSVAIEGERSTCSDPAHALIAKKFTRSKVFADGFFPEHWSRTMDEKVYGTDADELGVGREEESMRNGADAAGVIDATQREHMMFSATLIDATESEQKGNRSEENVLLSANQSGPSDELDRAHFDTDVNESGFPSLYSESSEDAVADKDNTAGEGQLDRESGSTATKESIGGGEDVGSSESGSTNETRGSIVGSDDVYVGSSESSKEHVTRDQEGDSTKESKEGAVDGEHIREHDEESQSSEASKEHVTTDQEVDSTRESKEAAVDEEHVHEHDEESQSSEKSKEQVTADQEGATKESKDSIADGEHVDEHGAESQSSETSADLTADKESRGSVVDEERVHNDDAHSDSVDKSQQSKQDPAAEKEDPNIPPSQKKTVHDGVEVTEDELNQIRKHGLALSFVVPLGGVIFIAFTLANILEKTGIAAAIPESLIMIAIGVLLGRFLKLRAEWEFFESEESYTEVMTGVLNLVLLPILMFESGWSLRRLDFFSQFPYILLFAVVGVALSTCVVAGLIYTTGMLGWHGVSTGRTAFAYAALISATDPVATLSTYSKLKVEPLLNIMVFGESVINDAVAIVLFDVFNSDHFMLKKNGQHMTGFALISSVCGGVAVKFLTSMFFGFALGIVYTLIAHWADMRENKKGQILVILASCYLTFALAEVCEMSGIIAEIFCALLMGVYMRPHLSTEGSLLATFFVKQLAMLADACVFLLVGVSVNQLTYNGWYFGLWAMLFCLLGRFAAVYPLALVVNALKTMFGRRNGVPPEGWNLLAPKHVFMMFHAGLRGAIALALSLELGKWVDDIDGIGTRRALQTATFLLIVVFLVVFGGSTSACLNYFGIPMGQDMPANALSKTEDYGGMRGALKWLDKRILTPLLLGEDEKDRDIEERDAEEILREAGDQQS